MLYNQSLSMPAGIFWIFLLGMTMDMLPLLLILRLSWLFLPPSLSLSSQLHIAYFHGESVWWAKMPRSVRFLTWHNPHMLRVPLHCRKKSFLSSKEDYLWEWQVDDDWSVWCFGDVWRRITVFQQLKQCFTFGFLWLKSYSLINLINSRNNTY